MAFGKRKHKAREKCCRQCFAYIRADSRKCKYCGCIYKSRSQYLADKLRRAFGIARALRIDRAFPLEREKPNANGADSQKFFTRAEIEKLTRLDNFHILMFMSLDDIALLDEMALIDLGETLIRMQKH